MSHPSDARMQGGPVNDPRVRARGERVEDVGDRGEDAEMLVEPQMRSDRAYLDLGCGVTELLTENRLYRRQNDWRDRSFLEPSETYKRFVLPPSEHLDMPEMGLASRYCHTSINKFRYPVFAVKWSPEGRRLITASQNGELTLWSSFGFIADKTIGSQDVVRTMTWTRSGDYMLTGDIQGVIKYWNPQMRLLKEIQAHNAGSAVRAMNFSPTDLKFVSGSDDVTVKIFDFETGREEMVLRGHGFDVKTTEWHPFKSLVLSGARDNLCKLWNPRTGKELCSIGGHKHTVTTVKWNPINGNWFCTGSRDKTLRVYDIRYMKKENPCLFQLHGHSTEVYSAAWHPQIESLLATGAYDGALMFWLINGADKDSHVQAVVPAAHEGSIWTMDWAPAGHLLSTGSQDKTCKFWSRMRPGMKDLHLYKGYQRSVDELDVLREMHMVPPSLPEYKSFQEMKESDKEDAKDVAEIESANDPAPLMMDTVINLGKKNFDRTLSQHQIERDIAFQSIPGIPGQVGMEQAKSQAGFKLVPPKIFCTFSDGRNYDPKPDDVKLLAALRSGILSRQNESRLDDSNFAGGGGGGPRTNGPSQPGIDLASLPGPRITGVVKMFNERGFGFIKPHDTQFQDLFAVKNDILPGYGHGGEQRLESGDIVVFRVEIGENKKTGQPQEKAKQIIHGDYDPERVKAIEANEAGPARPRYERRDNQRSDNDRQADRNAPPRHQYSNPGYNQSGGPPSNQYGGGSHDRHQSRDDHRHPPPRDHHHGGNFHQDSRGGGQPPRHQQQHQNRPANYGQLTPELFELLNRYANDQRILDRILADHGVTREQVRQAIEQAQGSA
mmetsp:Transcript_12491/g.23188  ORF Transcript_12491/g.23188 Transcript_12491/m.23188 type:complete len:835 (-) Transcript_12491:57-2561(-)